VGAGDAVSTPNSVESTFKFGSALPGDEKPDFKKFVPAEYAEEPWVKNLEKSENPSLELFKQMKGLQTKLGAPKENAAKSVDDFKVEPIAWAESDKEIGSQIEASRPEGLMTELKKAALEDGMTTQQFQKLVHTHDKLQLQKMKEWESTKETRLKEYDKEFDKMMSDKFGARVNEVKANGMKILQSSKDPDLINWLRVQDNKTLTMVAAVLNETAGNYLREDGFNRNGVSNSDPNGDAVKKERLALMSSKAYGDVLHPEHEMVKKRVNQLYGTNQK